MKTKIFIYLNDETFSNYDLTNPEVGNPGVGGTPYCFSLLLKKLGQDKNHSYVFIHHNKSNSFFVSEEIIVKSFEEASAIVGDKGILICRFINEQSFYDTIKENNNSVILWAHNFLLLNGLKNAFKSDNVKRVVFVGRELYECYIDDPIIKKSTCIENMYCISEIKDHEKENAIIYTGALIQSKGFHVLAKHWNYISSKCGGNIKLYVMGTAKLYNSSTKLGDLNISTPEYESLILKSFGGKIPSNVKFLGLIKENKNYYYSKSLIGVINPTGESEILPITALEMQNCNLPIASIYKYGNIDAIMNKKTGLLARTEKGFAKNVVKLYKNKELRDYLSTNCRNYINERFNPDTITNKWLDLFKQIECDEKNIYLGVKGSLTNDYKLLKIINRYLRFVFPFLPSVSRLILSLKSLRKN